MSLSESLGRFLNSLSLYFRLVILRIALFVRQTIIYRTSPARSSTHTALLIGDSNALGLGDAPGKLGLCGRLSGLLRSQNVSDRPRTFWHILTAGRLHARAVDWDPTIPAGLFERVLVRGPFRVAHVVIVLLGTHDDVAAAPVRIAGQVAKVAEGLVRLGKHTVIASFPNPHPHRTPEHAAVRKANEELTGLLQEVKRNNSTPDCGSLAWDIEMAKVFAMGNEVLRFENDFVGLNGSGFRFLASEVYDAFVLSAKRAEWDMLKGRLVR